LTGIPSDVAALLKPSAVGGLALLRARARAYPDQSWAFVLKVVAASYEGQAFDLDAADRLHQSVPSHLIDRADIFRGAIRAVAETLPPWLEVLCDGREALYDLDPSLVACFERAGAMAPVPDETVIRWWNALIELAYMHRESGNLQVGRKAERLSLERERRLLSGSSHPDIFWTALDTNTAGYDIHSWERSHDEWLPKLIEVKAISRLRSPIYLTRHEWETAKRMSSAYRFQIWDLQSERIAELSGEQMSSHVPEDRGLGKWNELKITLPSEIFVPA
jgi:Domain of unknown function (DUF3883)